jgi:hypothetical protein
LEYVVTSHSQGIRRRFDGGALDRRGGDREHTRGRAGIGAERCHLRFQGVRFDQFSALILRAFFQHQIVPVDDGITATVSEYALYFTRFMAYDAAGISCRIGA